MRNINHDFYKQTNRLAKTLSGVALAFACISSAHASLVDFTWNNVTFEVQTARRATTYDTYVFSGTTTYDTDLMKMIDTSALSVTKNGDASTQLFYNGSFFKIGTYIYTFVFDTNFDASNLNITSNLVSVSAAINNSPMTRNASGSRTYALRAAATAVPEPEVYVMMLAGLGLVGFAARRKQQAAKRKALSQH